MISTIANWFKQLFYIVRNYDKDLDLYMQRIHNLEVQNAKLTRIIRSRTQVSSEVSHHGSSPHVVVLTGVYKNRDYVEIFNVTTDDFRELVELLRRIEEHAQLNRLDTGPYRPALRRIAKDELNF